MITPFDRVAGLAIAAYNSEHLAETVTKWEELPQELRDQLNRADELCIAQGGRLKSRQAIATIICMVPWTCKHD